MKIRDSISIIAFELSSVSATVGYFIAPAEISFPPAEKNAQSSAKSPVSPVQTVPYPAPSAAVQYE